MSVANWTKYKQIQLFVDRNAVNDIILCNILCKQKKEVNKSRNHSGAEFLDYLIALCWY